MDDIEVMKKKVEEMEKFINDEIEREGSFTDAWGKVWGPSTSDT